MSADLMSPRPSATPAPNATRRELGAAFGVLVLGAAGVLGAVSRTWVAVRALRDPPLPPLSLQVGGRSLSPAVAGLGLVLLAGAVAILATGGRLRQVLGAVLAAAGAGVAAVSVRDALGVSDARARELVLGKASGIGLAGDFPVQVHQQPLWPWLAAAGGTLCALAGLAVVLRGARWRSMGARYEAPGATGSGPAGGRRPATDDGPEGAADRRAAEDLALWNALDRGDDPTRH